MLQLYQPIRPISQLSGNHNNPGKFFTTVGILLLFFYASRSLSRYCGALPLGVFLPSLYLLWCGGWAGAVFCCPLVSSRVLGSALFAYINLPDYSRLTLRGFVWIPPSLLLRLLPSLCTCALLLRPSSFASLSCLPSYLRQPHPSFLVLSRSADTLPLPMFCALGRGFGCPCFLVAGPPPRLLVRVLPPRRPPPFFRRTLCPFSCRLGQQTRFCEYYPHAYLRY